MNSSAGITSSDNRLLITDITRVFRAVAILMPGGLYEIRQQLDRTRSEEKIAEYRRKARRFGKLWMEHGALEYVECVAENVKKGKVTSFPQSVNLKRDETVALAWLGFKSRAHHDRVMKKAMADPRMQKLMDPSAMLFDGIRMFWGGFEVMVKL